MAATLSRRDLIRQARGLALATPFLSLPACVGEDERRRLTSLTGATMGTTYGVKITDLPAGTDRDTLKAGIDRVLETVNRQMSTYRPESELSRFNAATSTAWLAVSADTLTVIEAALAVSRLSRGAFDATVAPLIDLWGFGPAGGDRRLPPPEALAGALAKVGYQNLRTDAAGPAIAKNEAGLGVDLSGIAKGFGVDKVAEYLERAGVADYLVEVGGELRGRGRSPRGDAWRIGIEKPRTAPGIVQRVVRLDGRALATSGDYRNFFERDGARYSHIISPRSGRPVAHGLASVSVIADSTMRADAWSTALMVLGPEAGPALARREGVAAFFIVRRGDDFVEAGSPEFAQYLTV